MEMPVVSLLQKKSGDAFAGQLICAGEIEQKPQYKVDFNGKPSKYYYPIGWHIVRTIERDGYFTPFYVVRFS